MGRIGNILDWEIAFTQKAGSRQGRQMPDLNEAHQTNIDGLYALGDLADAPVIKIALNQGYETVQNHIAPELKAQGPAPEGTYDIGIVGCGPAGVGAALRALEEGLSIVIFEKERPLNTIQNYPEHKHVFVEPKGLELKAPLWLKESLKEDLLERWEQDLLDHELERHDPQKCIWCHLKQPAEVKNVRKEGDVFTIEVGEEQYRARRVILAIGRRGTPRKLNVPGEAPARVRYALHDAGEHAGQNVLVVGGGDSAVEAAIALSDKAARTFISYRQDSFHRAKSQNRAEIERKIAEGKIQAFYRSTVKEIAEKEVTLATGEGDRAVAVDQVYTLLGSDLPTPFLKKIGVRMEGAWTVRRAMWLVLSFLLVYSLYAIKSYPPMWPYNKLGEWLAGLEPGSQQAKFWAPNLLTFTLGGRDFGPSFHYSLLYTAIMWFFGIQCILKYPARFQKLRYASLIFFQTFFFFAVPEFIAPWIFRLADWGSEAWRTYGLVYAWPLAAYAIDTPFVNPETVLPNWAHEATPRVHAFFFWWALGLTFVAIPIYVRWGGKSFCTWICGCGGLAETLGDRWRHLAPKGPVAKKWEWMTYPMLAFAFIVGLLIVNDIWKFIDAENFRSAKTFSQSWYNLIVDFWLVAVIPVALYPFLGGKIWCRYWCPLAKYMEILAKRYSKAKITADSTCIGCGQCSRYCQVGIDVQAFAQKRETLDNSNSCCIQCGICLQVCPMETLKFGPQPVDA